MTQIFETQHSINPKFMKEIFVFNSNQYALRKEHPIKLPRLRTTTYGQTSISFLGGKLWHVPSVETKQSLSLNQFKTRIQTGKRKNVVVIYVDAMWVRLDIFNGKRRT